MPCFSFTSVRLEQKRSFALISGLALLNLQHFSLDRVLAREDYSPHSNLFPADATLQAYRCSITMPMANVQMSASFPNSTSSYLHRQNTPFYYHYNHPYFPRVPKVPLFLCRADSCVDASLNISILTVFQRDEDSFSRIPFP